MDGPEENNLVREDNKDSDDNEKLIRTAMEQVDGVYSNDRFISKANKTHADNVRRGANGCVIIALNAGTRVEGFREINTLVDEHIRKISSLLNGIDEDSQGLILPRSIRENISQALQHIANPGSHINPDEARQSAVELFDQLINNFDGNTNHFKGERKKSPDRQIKILMEPKLFED